MKTSRLSGSGNLDDNIRDCKFIIIIISELELRSDLKSVGSREQACKESDPRLILPHAFRRRLISSVELQYLASKTGERHLA